MGQGKLRFQIFSRNTIKWKYIIRDNHQTCESLSKRYTVPIEYVRRIDFPTFADGDVYMIQILDKENYNVDELSRSGMKIIRPLGSGSYGNVMLIEEDGEEYALKVCHLSQNEFAQHKREFSIQDDLRQEMGDREYSKWFVRIHDAWFETFAGSNKIIQNGHVLAGEKTAYKSDQVMFMKMDIMDSGLGKLVM